MCMCIYIYIYGAVGFLSPQKPPIGGSGKLNSESCFSLTNPDSISRGYY